MPSQKLKNALRRGLTLLGLALAVVVVIGLALMLQAMPERVQSGSVAHLLPMETPQPTEDVVHPIQMVGPDGQQMPSPPTWTPFPTWTPRPTPTRRPGPTVTPFPFKTSAPDASGMVIYVQHDSNEVKYISVGSNAEKLTEPETFPLPLHINVSGVYPSPDGQHLLLMNSSFPGGYPYLLSRQSGQMYPLIDESTTMSGRFFSWHPDGQQILFWPTIDELWLIDVVSRERTILSLLNGSVQGAAISPNGQQVAYVTFVDDPSQMAQYGIWIVSTAGSDARPVLNLKGAAYLFGWSPDGNYLLYLGKPSAKQDDVSVGETQGPLWISEPDGSNSRALSLPYLNGFGYEPTWSPDSKWIASVGLQDDAKSGCHSTAQTKWPDCQFEGVGIYVENVETGEMRYLAMGIKPVWSPDGNYLAFLALKDSSIGIRIISLSDLEVREVTLNEQSVNSVTWISDSEVRP